MKFSSTVSAAARLDTILSMEFVDSATGMKFMIKALESAGYLVILIESMT